MERGGEGRSVYIIYYAMFLCSTRAGRREASVKKQMGGEREGEWEGVGREEGAS